MCAGFMSQSWPATSASCSPSAGPATPQIFFCLADADSSETIEAARPWIPVHGACMPSCDHMHMLLGWRLHAKVLPYCHWASTPARHDSTNCSPNQRPCFLSAPADRSLIYMPVKAAEHAVHLGRALSAVLAARGVNCLVYACRVTCLVP